MNNQIHIDCIADLHFSAKIIPPLLPELARRRYDLFLTECGLGVEVGSAGAGGEPTFMDQQLQYAEKSETLDIGARLAKTIHCEPITIDDPVR